MHINCVELLARAFVIQSFTQDRAVLHVRLRMDNSSTLSYRNRLWGGWVGGGRKSLVLSNLAVSLLHRALEKWTILSAEHLLGITNQIVV